MHLLLFCFLLLFNCVYAGDCLQFKGAIIGYGNMGQLHADHFSSLCQEISIVEIDDRRISSAIAHGYKVYSSLDELIANHDIDFVAICTPTYLHLEHIRYAIKHNLPIFVEKPVVRTLLEAEELRKLPHAPQIFVAEVEHYNSKLMGFLFAHTEPSLIRVSRSVNLNYFIGDSSPWFIDEDKSGGIATDLMIHDISLLIGQFGKPRIKKVNLSQEAHPYVDQVDVILGFDGFDAVLHADWLNKDSCHPISTEWVFFDREGDYEFVVCNDYLERLEDDPYLKQDHQFLKSLSEGTLKYPLETYLLAVEIADQIRSQ